MLENTKDLNIVLKKLKYKKLQKEKDILNQTIKEKKNICDNFKKQIEYEKDLGSIFQPKNLIFFDNLYYIKNEFLKINLKKVSLPFITLFIESAISKLLLTTLLPIYLILS